MARPRSSARSALSTTTSRCGEPNGSRARSFGVADPVDAPRMIYVDDGIRLGVMWLDVFVLDEERGVVIAGHRDSEVLRYASEICFPK